MKYRKLGRTGIDVSAICLGTMTWGSQNPEAEGHAQMDYAVGQGVNFFDTAEMYPTTPFSLETAGRTEEIIGTWFAGRGRRDDIVLATKVVGNNSHGGEYGAEITPEKIRRSCERSLRRLQTDYIDLYQLHWPNRGSYHFRQTWTYRPGGQDTARARDDIEAALSELDRLVKEGKIRHAGLSNDTVWGAAQFIKLAETKGWPRIATIQNEYSLLHRIFDTDWAEFSHHEDVGLICYSPLAAGLLSGKYRDGSVPAGTRLSMQPNMNGRYQERSRPALEAYFQVADKHGLDPAQMALAFCLSRPFMTSVIIGATSLAQLKTDIASVDLELSDEVLDDILEVYKRHPVPM